MTVSRVLAEFATRPADPVADGATAEVFAQCVLRGVADNDAVRVTYAAADAIGSAETASVLGYDRRVGPLWAPLLNGTAMHRGDDPDAPVVAAALCAAELAGRSGAELLDAVRTGLEVAVRVGHALGPSHPQRGWHLTGTAGRLGAAAAAVRLFRLSAAEAVVALGAACVEAAGLRAARGSMTEPYHAGKAAADGVEAAMLVRDGLTGPDDPVGARRGLLALMSANADADRLVDGLGTRWHPLGVASAGPTGAELYAVAMSVADLDDVAPLFAAARAAR